jgi:hypothetical protein
MEQTYSVAQARRMGRVMRPYLESLALGPKSPLRKIANSAWPNPDIAGKNSCYHSVLSFIPQTIRGISIMSSRTLALVILESRINPGAYASSFTAGKLTLTGTDDAESIAIRDDGVGVTIMGQNLTTIDGQATKTFAGSVNSIKIVAKGGDDTVNFDSTNAIDFSGGLNVDLGASSTNGNRFDLNANVDIALGSVDLKGGDGIDTASFFGTTATIANDFRADFGDGESYLELRAGTTVFGNLFVDAGSGGDVLSLDGTTINGPGGVALNGRSGPAAIVAGNVASAVNGDIKVKSLDDSASLQNLAGLSSGGAVSVIGQTASLSSEGPFAARSVYVNGSDGATLSVPAFVANDIAFSSLANLSVIADDGEAFLRTDGGSFNVGGQLLVSGEIATVGLFSPGDVTIGGTALIVGDTVAFFQQANSNLTMNGKLTVQSDGFTNLYLHSLIGNFAKDVAVHGALWGTSLDVFGDITFDEDLSIVGRTTNNPDITGGTGSTTAVVESATGVKVNGNFSFTAKDRNDAVILTNVEVAGKTSIRTGAGDDFLQFDGGDIFEGTTSIDTGAGDDFLQFARTTGLLVDAVTFVGKATIKAGAGNDRLEAGRSLADGGDSHSLVAFNTQCSVVDGGTGNNIFNEALGQITGAPSVVNWVSE